jgi:glycosyltransferase involved in cell wall biosynthesis
MVGELAELSLAREPFPHTQTRREWPRVLVMGQDLPHLGRAGSIILYRLFEDWPSDKLLALGPTVEGETRLACSFRLIEPVLGRWDFSRAARAVRFLRGLGVLRSRMLPLEDWKPQVIVHVLSNLAHSDIAYGFSRKFGIPLVLIVHDDPEDFNQTYPWARSFVRRSFRRAYRHAAARLCVSLELEQALALRYGVSGTVMYPNRSKSLLPRPAEDSAKLRTPGVLTLGFAGSLGYGYGPRLQELVPFLRESGSRIRIYGADLPYLGCDDVLLGEGRMRTPEEAWDRIKRECDAVILPYCYPHHGHETLYRTHFPSKLTEYLALGMPVIVSGPNYATGVRWGMAHSGACQVVTELGRDAWLQCLARLRSESWHRMQLAEGALRAAQCPEFDPVSIEEFFYSLLTTVSIPAVR